MPPPPPLPADIITHWPELYNWASRLAIRPQASPVPTSLKLGLQAYLPCLAFYQKSYGDLNPGPQACAASMVPSHLSSGSLSILSPNYCCLSLERHRSVPSSPLYSPLYMSLHEVLILLWQSRQGFDFPWLKMQSSEQFKSSPARPVLCFLCFREMQQQRAAASQTSWGCIKSWDWHKHFLYPLTPQDNPMGRWHYSHFADEKTEA